jgi:hypothetical protein
MSEVLGQQIQFFKEHQNEFADKHHGLSVLIHDRSVAGFYKSELDAYMAAEKKKFSPGSFLIRQCIRSEEETSVIFRSRVAG